MSGKITKSDEGDALGLRLSRAEGEAFQAILKHMVEDVADGGAKTEHGDYLIAYASEKAEGMYVQRNGKFEWEEPEEGNVHIEVVVCDKADGRFVPILDVTATLSDEKGREIGTHRLPLLWHPYLYHYGRNWHIPASGHYDLRIRFPAPAFPRHDRENGCRMAEGADVTFERVYLKTGRE